MSHSELHGDGSRIDSLLRAPTNEKLSKMFGGLSNNAFMTGATEVHQKVIHDNDRCPCNSGIRFDLCCKNK